MLPICLLADTKVSMVWSFAVFRVLDTSGTIQTMWFQRSVYYKQITNFSYEFLGMNVIARLRPYLQRITSRCLQISWQTYHRAFLCIIGTCWQQTLETSGKLLASLDIVECPIVSRWKEVYREQRMVPVDPSLWDTFKLHEDTWSYLKQIAGYHLMGC